VERLRDELRLPGMLVLQFAFSDGLMNPQRAISSRSNCVVYTGTHDKTTTPQWWDEASEAERTNARQAFAAARIDDHQPHWGLIELALRSSCRLAIIPAQDLLGLGAGARMNTPWSKTGNWSWRLHEGALTPELAQRLRLATERAKRIR
jgi:4-alpha-glucanotransferase